MVRTTRRLFPIFNFSKNWNVLKKLNSLAPSGASYCISPKHVNNKNLVQKILVE